MTRKLLGVFTAVAAALLLVGVAWAGSDGAPDDDPENVVETRMDSSTDVTLSSTVTTDDDRDDNTTSTTIDDDSGGDD